MLSLKWARGDLNSGHLAYKTFFRVRPDGRPVMLYWCDGIAYAVYSMGEKTWDDELIKGKYHLSTVYFAEMPEFKPILEISTEQFGGLKVPIIDMSMVDIDKTLIKFLKGKPK